MRRVYDEFCVLEWIQMLWKCFYFFEITISCINVSVMPMHTHVSVNSDMFYVKWCKCKLFLIEDVT